MYIESEKLSEQMSGKDRYKVWIRMGSERYKVRIRVGSE